MKSRVDVQASPVWKVLKKQGAFDIDPSSELIDRARNLIYAKVQTEGLGEGRNGERMKEGILTFLCINITHGKLRLCPRNVTKTIICTNNKDHEAYRF